MNSQVAHTDSGDANENGVPNNQPELIQFLTFKLGKEEYGIDILRIHEIRCWESVSRIPNVPHYEKGVLNLRGAIVPVIDLRERFGFESAETTEITAVIIVQVHEDEESKIMGMIVDSVSDVADVEKSLLQKAPEFGEKVNTQFISSLATANDRMIRVLNVDKLMQLNGVSQAD